MAFLASGVHTSVVFPSPSRDQTIVLPTSRSASSHKHDSDILDVLPEHATESSILHDPQVHVLLRVLHDRRIIELISLASSTQSRRFTFPSPIILSPAVIFDDPKLHIIACTKSGSLYRLSLPLPQLWESHPLSNNWCTEYPIVHSPDSLLGPIHVKGAGSVYIGLEGGAVLNLQATKDLGDSEFSSWNEYILKPPVHLSLTSLLPFQSRPQLGASNNIALMSVPNSSLSTVVFTLQRDRTLRVWEKGASVTSISVPPSFSTALVRGSSAGSSFRSVPILDPEPRNFLCAFPPPDGDQVDDGQDVMVFMPSASGGFFNIYRLSPRSNKIARSLVHLGSKAASESSQTRQLRDFMILDDLLWVLWDEEGATSVEFTGARFDLNESELSWVSVHNPTEPDLNSTHYDDQSSFDTSFADIYLKTLLRPGLFSKYTLRAALQQYTTSLLSIPGPHTSILTASYDSLSEHIAAVVGCTVNLGSDPATGEQLWEPYWNALRRDWEGLLARCREIERSARWPLKFGRSGHGEPLVLERERLVAIAPVDAAMRLHSSMTIHTDIRIDPQAQLILRLGHAIRASLAPAARDALESAIIDAVRSEAHCTYSEASVDLSQKWLLPFISEQTLSSLDNQFKDDMSVEQPIRWVLESLLDTEAVKPEADVGIEDLSTFPPPLFSWQSALSTAYASHTLKIRHDTALATLTLLLYLSVDRPHLISTEPSVIGQAFATLQSISMLHHLSTQPSGDPESAPVIPGDDDVANLMQGMHVSGSSFVRPPTTTYSLLHLMLQKYVAPLPADQNTRPSAIAHRFLLESGILRCKVSPDASQEEVLLLRRVLEAGHLGVARNMAEWMPRTPGVAYLLARVLLESGRADDATALLQRVAYCTGVGAEQLDDYDTLLAALPGAEEIESTASYYRHVVSLFEARQLSADVVNFAQLAIQNSIAKAPETADLWNKVFRGNLDLGRYQEAYVVMVSTPFPDLQRDLVRNLVSTMCDNGEVEQLLRLDFIHFHSDVENTLAFKARHSDLRQVPNYAQVMHAWFVNRGDFRSAGASMYQHGRRLGDLATLPNVDYGSTASAQAQSYLAAINALSLVDAKNAWIEYVVPPSDTQNKRRRLVKHIPEEQFNTTGLNVDVVSLSDIRQEYMLVLSRLELGSYTSNPHVYSMSSEDIVTSFMEAGQLDSAMSAARSFSVDMTSLFGLFTAQCMRLAQSRDEETDPVGIPWLMSEKVASWEGTNLQRAWRYLRISLETHDSLDIDWLYRKVVFQKILELDRLSRVPTWLVMFFEENQPEYLIRTSLKYGLVKEAVSYTLGMVRKANALLTQPLQASSSQNGQSSSSYTTWLPYTLIDQVLLAASEAEKQDASLVDNVLVQRLRNELGTRINKVKKWSEAPQKSAAEVESSESGGLVAGGKTKKTNGNENGLSKV